MNKLIYLLILCLFVCVADVKALDLNPSDANIVGHVVEMQNHEHLPFMHIFLKGTTIGTSSDATGHYYLKNLPEGKFTIIMKGIGYKTIEKDIVLRKGKTLEVNFDAEEDRIALDGIVVSANRNETT